MWNSLEPCLPMLAGVCNSCQISTHASKESEPLEVFKTSKGFNYRGDLAMHYEASPMLKL